MSNSTMQIIEINGIKMEVDMRHAKRIDHLTIGSRVKCLLKQYSDYKVMPGVIVGFEPFQNLPSIVVAYLDIDYSGVGVKFKSYNTQTADFEIIADADQNSLEINREDILQKFDMELTKKRIEIEEIENKCEFFKKNFGTYFADLPQSETAE